MGSYFRLDGPRMGTSNPQFKIEFTDKFKSMDLKFGFRIRRSPNHDMWQPLFCCVSDKGIDWKDGWNSDNIFSYMVQDCSWYNSIEIEAGEMACSIQLIQRAKIENIEKQIKKLNS